MIIRPSKKMLPFCILAILKKYSDEEHRLSQKEIGEILRDRYDLSVDRKTIKRALSDIEDFGYPIEYREATRAYWDEAIGAMEESLVVSDFYLVPEFTNTELEYLINLLHGTNLIPEPIAHQLIKKLENQSNDYFRYKIHATRWSSMIMNKIK